MGGVSYLAAQSNACDDKVEEMRTALEEISDTLKFVEGCTSEKPADSLSKYDKGFFYRTGSWSYYSIYIFKTALGINSDLEQTLEKTIKMSEKAISCYPEESLKHLQPLFIAKSLLGENLTEPAKQIIEVTRTHTEEDVSPLISMVACLYLGEDYISYMKWLEKWESKKYTSVLPGCSDALIHLMNRDEDNLVKVLDVMLLAHNKEANNRHSHIYNTYNSFLSLAPYFMLKLAEFFDMNIRSRVSENKQALKLGLRSPADFPDIPKNYKMPIEVDYLTAKTNVATSATD